MLKQPTYSNLRRNSLAPEKKSPHKTPTKPTPQKDQKTSPIMSRKPLQVLSNSPIEADIVQPFTFVNKSYENQNDQMQKENAYLKQQLDYNMRALKAREQQIETIVVQNQRELLKEQSLRIQLESKIDILEKQIYDTQLQQQNSLDSKIQAYIQEILQQNKLLQDTIQDKNREIDELRRQRPQSCKQKQL